MPRTDTFHVPDGSLAASGSVILNVPSFVARYSSWRVAPSGSITRICSGIDPDTTIVVNCAGRTRSIIGAQSLINAAVPNQVVSLEGGTQAWRLAGLELERDTNAALGPVSLDTRCSTSRWATSSRTPRSATTG